MQEQNSHTASGEGTQGAPYTPAELALIEELAPQIGSRARIEALFPHRSPGAVKKKLVEARHRLGLVKSQSRRTQSAPLASNALSPDDPGEADSWFPRHCRAMQRGSMAFLEALRAA
jgi:hypothetical protein